MVWKVSTANAAVVVGALLGLVVGTLAWRFAFFYAPFAWTGEPARLARALGLQPRMQIADIGAGSGALAVAMATYVGSDGRVFATELDPQRRAAIERRVSRAGLRNVQVVAAGRVETGLPTGCCHAIYMRAVFHHIADRATFAAKVARALRPGGRVGVIDFAPGTLWFHGADHGVEADLVVRVFQAAGFRLSERLDHWGGRMFLLVLEREITPNGSNQTPKPSR
jgi:ubiquinone/menaquinone biosynthesis C-methylase UbiE